MSEPFIKPTPEDRAGRRRAARSKRFDSWVWGIVLIIVGIFLLLSTANIISINVLNWWALFILIPAVGGFATAINQYREAGRWTARVTGSIIGACTVALVALAFLLNWNWSKIWPLFLVTGGVAVLAGGFAKREEEDEA